MGMHEGKVPHQLSVEHGISHIYNDFHSGKRQLLIRIGDHECENVGIHTYCPRAANESIPVQNVDISLVQEVPKDFTHTT